jgi:hypothetical protein
MRWQKGKCLFVINRLVVQLFVDCLPSYVGEVDEYGDAKCDTDDRPHACHGIRTIFILRNQFSGVARSLRVLDVIILE